MTLKTKKPLYLQISVAPDPITDYANLFERYQTELIRYLYSLVGEVETARDLTQETFLRGYPLWLEKPERTGWRPLLYKIATNCGLDLLRRRNKIRFVSWPDQAEDRFDRAEMSAAEQEAAASLPDLTGQFELRLAIIEALRGLDPEAATCLLLHYDQGFSCAEIAAMTDSSLQAIWQRLSRARRLFCSLYQKEQASDA